MALLRNRQFVDSPLEGDGFELPVREHRAMAPSHGFAAASDRESNVRTPDRLRGFVDERQYPGHDVACQLVSDLAEHHDLAPFEQA